MIEDIKSLCAVLIAYRGVILSFLSLLHHVLNTNRWRSRNYIVLNFFFREKKTFKHHARNICKKILTHPPAALI